MVWRRLSLMDLAAVGGFIGIIGAGAGLTVVNHRRQQVRKQDYYKQAMKLFEANKAAVDLVGYPVYRYRIDLSDSENNWFGPMATRIKVPIKGTKRSGNLHVWADRVDTDCPKEWTVRRIEMTLDDIYDRKVLVYKNNDKSKINSID
ncbi:uncharacterized protein LOC128957120 [Oppia nitens]|uniref:uncharacterized protein LOC128957120 n=1 Tax=Oppia nitens TaxID=1686743 RepID=UPI0023DAFA36|nr:uncharacterized protein LOC128957120 [Oppia nitens]